MALLEFLKQADAAGKIITYICHGGIPVAAADLIKGKKATGWQASKDSIEIMGGEYNENWAAVVDGSQVSGRTPPEIPEYVDAIMVALLCGELNIEELTFKQQVKKREKINQ